MKPVDWERWRELLVIKESRVMEMTAIEWRQYDEIRQAIDELAAECEMGWRKGCRGKP